MEEEEQVGYLSRQPENVGENSGPREQIGQLSEQIGQLSDQIGQLSGHVGQFSNQPEEVTYVTGKPEQVTYVTGQFSDQTRQ